MPEKPTQQPDKQLYPKQVDYVALSQGTTRAHAVFLLRAGYELPPNWESELQTLYTNEPAKDDALANELKAKEERAKKGKP